MKYGGICTAIGIITFLVGIVGVHTGRIPDSAELPISIVGGIVLLAGYLIQRDNTSQMSEKEKMHRSYREYASICLVVALIIFDLSAQNGIELLLRLFTQATLLVIALRCYSLLFEETRSDTCK